MSEPMIRMHVIRIEAGTSDSPIAILFVHAVPRVGDEIRLSSTTFFKVERIVWCLDEADRWARNIQRVNIGVKAIE